MKALFSAFPLLKKKRFYAFLVLAVLLCAVTGFLYTPEQEIATLTFEEERSAIEEAVRVAEQQLLTCSEDEKAIFLQQKAYYESALKFRLSPWSTSFAYEGLSLYASLSLRGGEEEKLQKLEKILNDRDAAGLCEFCKSDPSLPDLDPRRLLAEHSDSPGVGSLLYDISLLEDSLATGKDRYFAKERDLTEGDKALFEKLLKHKEKLLPDGKSNPVPLNKQTLLNAEHVVACLLTVLLLALAGIGPHETRQSRFALLLIPLAASVLICAAALFFTTLFSAPGTMEAEFLQWGGTLPFFPALFFRLLSRVLGSLPLMLLCLFLRGKNGQTKWWKILAFLPLIRFIFSVPLSMSGLAAIGNLSLCLFPDLAANTVKNTAPWLGVLLWLLALGASLWLLWKKEQKITDEKQELSLEKQSEL